MKAVVLTQFGEPEVLVLQDVAKPSPAQDEVLVKIQNTAVNALDWKLRKGMGEKFGLHLKLPFILGSEISGVVETVGADVHGFKAGDEVFGCVYVLRSGGYSEYLTAKENELADRKPATSAMPSARLIMKPRYWAAYIAEKAETTAR